MPYADYKTPPGGMRRDQIPTSPLARAQQAASGRPGAAFKPREVQMGDKPRRSQYE